MKHELDLFEPRGELTGADRIVIGAIAIVLAGWISMLWSVLV